MNVGLGGQVLGGSIGRIVVDDEEPIDAQTAIMLEKSRKTKTLVPAPRERTNFAWRCRGAAIDGPVYEHMTVIGHLHFPEPAFSVSKKRPHVD
jgi:hypothetical protein